MPTWSLDTTSDVTGVKICNIYNFVEVDARTDVMHDNKKLVRIFEFGPNLQRSLSN